MILIKKIKVYAVGGPLHNVTKTIDKSFKNTHVHIKNNKSVAIKIQQHL